MSQQKDGCYPRVTGTMLRDGYHGMVVSLVGRVLAGGSPALVEFQTADQSVVALKADQYAGEVPLSEANPGMVMEIIGQTDETGSVTAFISRELSLDMDLEVYNKMIQLQQAPQFQSLFGTNM